MRLVSPCGRRVWVGGSVYCLGFGLWCIAWCFGAYDEHFGFGVCASRADLFWRLLGVEVFDRGALMSCLSLLLCILLSLVSYSHLGSPYDACTLSPSSRVGAASCQNKHSMQNTQRRPLGQKRSPTEPLLICKTIPERPVAFMQGSGVCCSIVYSIGPCWE